MYILIKPKPDIIIDDKELINVVKLSVNVFEIIRTWHCDCTNTFYTLQINIKTDSHELIHKIVSTIEMRFAHLSLDCKIIKN